MVDNKKVINQTRYEALIQEGFPEGCLSDVYVDGVVITKLPQNIEIRNTRFFECRFKDIAVETLTLNECVVSDGVFVNIKTDELSLHGATVYGTLFTGLSIEKMDMSQATFRKSSMRDGDIMEMNLLGATLDSMYFYRMAARSVHGIEQARFTMGGATYQEVDNYRRLVKETLMPMYQKQDKVR